MNAQQLKEKMQKGDEMLLFDIRESEELVDVPPIAGSIHMPMGRMLEEANSGTLPNDKKMIAICRTGRRSDIVARELTEKSYDIESLEGGVVAWLEEKKAV
ncbi:MAG: rhodanese domain-containing protein [Parcubacteria group bacterium Gr01-1014_8]|nr:MAG: rhodanese domain-containing protein [Parcubacteria group bacterium Gr01-1014_8]